MAPDLLALQLSALFLGIVHTALGPDHYLPFIALARARSWSRFETVWITTGCGLVHVSASALLGIVGVWLGWSLADLSFIQASQGRFAAWALIGFGLAYAAWGWRKKGQAHRHTHWHSHADGEVHSHSHNHSSEHAHVHAPAAKGLSVTPWILFTIFIFGPCEALIPLLMVPAASRDVFGLGLVIIAFALGTIATMITLVALGSRGLTALSWAKFELHAHTVAGLVLVACGIAILSGF
jgi:sulfite exporter TauE/SafE